VTAFRNWLLRTAANTCYDVHRRRRRRPVTPLEGGGDTQDETGRAPVEGGSPAARLADPNPGPEERVVQSELEALVQRALLALPVDQRTALVLCDVYGLDYQSIAAATDVELGTVKSRLNRARYRLRDLLLEHRELLPDRYRHR
jgi:RNA polymerase sigma-70 factor (ECF subfamily)